MTQKTTSEETRDDFAAQAEGTSGGIFSEMAGMLRTRKKLWMTPIIVILLVVGILVILGGTAVAPFIYAIF